MVSQKVQLDPDDLEFIEKARDQLGFRSKSEYMRAAIRARIRADKARLRALVREKAMEAYGEGQTEVVFAGLEGDDFKNWRASVRELRGR